jgi:hypothetical protein
VPGKPTVHRLAAVAAIVLLLVPGVADAARAEGTISLIPEGRGSWSPGKIFSFLRPNYNYGARYIEVETSPSDADLDLFYIRSNFQKRYEQAKSPIKIVLPVRADAGPRDAVVIRASKEGYVQKEVTIRVDSREDHVVLDLDPLPNSLMAASQVYLAGRSTLSLLTTQSLSVRVQKQADGFNVILAETALGSDVGDSLGTIENPLISKVESIQLGEDLLIRVRTRPDAQKGYELRSRESHDDLRGLYVYALDLVPADAGVSAVQRARAALAALSSADVTGCALTFDQHLRESLDAASLARALSPDGNFTDPYLRAAMKRLGEVSPGGRIHMLDGTAYDPSRPLELAAAMSEPASARGYLALLRAFIDHLEPADYRADTLRGLVAPELGAKDFAGKLDAAETAERSCSSRGRT